MKREICVKRWRCHKTNASRVALSYLGLPRFGQIHLLTIQTNIMSKKVERWKGAVERNMARLNYV